ncbi:MAG: ABC transporter substrate-binding protein [Paludibacteraceae bacterium]
MKLRMALKKESIFIGMVCLLLLAGCGKQQVAPIEVSEAAQYFRLTDTLGMVRADVLDPQNEGKLLARYYLVDEGLRIKDERLNSFDSEGAAWRPHLLENSNTKVIGPSSCVLHPSSIIPIPLRRVATTSATHIGFLYALGVLDSVVAMSNPEWVYNKPSHEVANIGEDINIAMEPLLLAKPDVLFASSYGQNSQQIARVAEAGIPVIYLAEWQEQHPLARAEWLRFVAAFFGKTALADSILGEVRSEYREQGARNQEPRLNSYIDKGLRTQDKRLNSTDSKLPRPACGEGAGGGALKEVRSPGRTPHEENSETNVISPSSYVLHPSSIMSGASYRGTWYVPSGTTYMGCLFRDAGAAYAFADERTNGSIPLTMEQALRAFSEADVWVGANARTMDELRAIDEHHTWFKAYRTGRVYHFYNRTNSTGGNDFWETGVVHPEIILRDLKWALYPDFYPDYEPYFIGRVQ